MSDDWKTGWPEKRGLYRCRADEEKEVYLVHHKCDVNGRHWWTDTRGYDVVGYQIEWIGDPIGVTAN